MEDSCFDLEEQRGNTDISLDDLYNNLKIYELEVTGSSSISQNPQNMAFVSSNSTNSNSITNEADNTAYGVRYDWSYQAEEEHPLNFALMPYTSSGSSSNSDSEGDAVEPKTVRKNNFRSPIIEDWNSDDDSKVEFIPNVKTVRPSTEKIKFVKSARETVEKVWKAKNSSASNTFKKYSYIDDEAMPSLKWLDPQKSLILLFYVQDNPQQKEYKEKGVFDSGCSRHMTGNKFYLTEYEDYDGGFVSFRDGKGRISRKGKIKSGTLANGSILAFDVDSLSKSMNYVPVVAGNQTNSIAGTRDNNVAGQAEKKTEPEQEYILIPIFTTNPLISQGPKGSEEDVVGMKPIEVNESGASNKGEEDEQDLRSKFERILQQEKQIKHPNSTNSINTISTVEPSSTNDAPSSPVNAAKTFEEHLVEQFSPFKIAFTLPDVPNVSPMDDNTVIFTGAYDDEDVGGQADLNNLETTVNVSSIPTTRINKDHPIELIIRDFHSAPLTRRMLQQNLEEHCLIEAMQEELLQFQLQKVWTLVDLPNGKRAIETK
ncbi:hypothetical protein Tco_0629609 [Tanacetum coccineum]|uniref:Retrovirus-related Pol polyprotein from transposon TNT 1-94-like beta-barrel domain-containing protein n=1 Tax=Tanacetum coccineum TaxID=301880 RepID=A0ABQ4WTP0_9ASTR